MHHAKTKYYTEGLTWVLPYLGLPINLPKELRGNACMPYSVNSTHCTTEKQTQTFTFFQFFTLTKCSLQIPMHSLYKYLC